MGTPSLAQRTVLVTGGSRGLGREMALAAAEAGADVMISARHASAALDETVASLKRLGPATSRAAAVIADVADPAACDNLVKETLRQFGKIDVLINNAGIGMRVVSETFTTEPTRFWETPTDAWKLIIDTNLNGSFYMASAVARIMVGQGYGKIINISTSAQTMVRRGYSPYGPSKAALEAASRIWAQDLEGTGVTVNVYLPGGASDTDLIPGGAGRKGADGNLLPASIMRRGIVWLCSAGSDDVTGKRFVARSWDPRMDPKDAEFQGRSDPVMEPAIM